MMVVTLKGSSVLMLNSALDGLGSSALGVAFGSSTLSSAHDRSTLGCALDGVGCSALAHSSVLVDLGGPALDGLGGSTLGSALDGLHGSALGVVFGGSTLSSAHDRLTLSSALNGVDSSTLGFALDGSSLDSVLLSTVSHGAQVGRVTSTSMTLTSTNTTRRSMVTATCCPVRHWMASAACRSTWRSTA